MLRTLHDLKFLFVAPLILLMLTVINLMTSPGHWWVQWPALGLGIAWVICLLRVVRAAVITGGLAALGVYLWRRRQAGQVGGPGVDQAI
jgi:hypothetical protein